jgi:hypothetical protein
VVPRGARALPRRTPQVIAAHHDTPLTDLFLCSALHLKL